MKKDLSIQNFQAPDFLEMLLAPPSTANAVQRRNHKEFVGTGVGAFRWIAVSTGLGGEVTCVGVGLLGVAGGVPEAVAVLCTLPAFTSSCVTVYVAVQVVLAFNASEVAGQLIALRPGNGSFTRILFNVTLPVFATTN